MIITIALTKYVLNKSVVSFQLFYNQETVTNFAISSMVPMITIGQKDPGNICASPMIEKKAATDANAIDVKNGSITWFMQKNFLMSFLFQSSIQLIA
jgi:hypothetical protein